VRTLFAEVFRGKEEMMSERTPSEIAAIDRLHKDFTTAIAKTDGIDRQVVLDALEYTMWNLLIECFDSSDALDQYLAVMRDRCLGTWRRHN
jgi:hypothetical protein